MWVKKKMKKRDGIEIRNKRNKKLSGLHEILRQWIKLIGDSSTEKDALYWYNERATVSTFAGAIWRAGGLALEEYRTIKRHGKTKWEGRSDLWFRWKNADYVVEAKLCWLSLNKGTTERNIDDAVNKKLKEAEQDVVCSHREGRPHRLGFVFVVPEIPKQDKRKTDKLLMTFLKRLRKIDFCLSAWNFPKITGKLEADNKIYPGVALIAESHKNQNK